MAPETRVGLVVGLAFIVCFAVILANRGRRQPTSTYLSNVSGSSAHLPQLKDSDFSLGSQRELSCQSPASESGFGEPVQPMPDRVDLTAQPSPGALDQQTSGYTPQRVADLGGWNSRDDHATDSVPNTPPQQTGILPRQGHLDRGRSTNDQSWAQQARARAHTANDSVRPQTPTVGEGGPGSFRRSRRGDQLTPSGSSRLHVVERGETLSRIAAKYYGRASAKAIQAIFEVNRSVMSSPDMVHVGVKLVIPDVGGDTVTPAGGSAHDPPTPQRTKRTGPSHNTPYRWYQIKKSDRYISIARNELGDASRWHEIHELNKDKFPDPGRIREGVRIRLPHATVASRGGV